MIIQVIGLPGSGKSTLIKKYLENKSLNDVAYYDMANFTGKDLERNFKKRIKSSSKKYILAESACGVHIHNSETIKLDIEIGIRREQYMDREGQEPDYHYESLLETRMVPPKYTIKNEQAFFDILDKLLTR